MDPKVLNRKYQRGLNAKNLGTVVYIGRPPKDSVKRLSGEHYGNPFSHLTMPGLIRVSDRSMAVAAFRNWLMGNWPVLADMLGVTIREASGILPNQRKWILQQLKDDVLKGKDLMCWCAEPNRHVECHGDVLIEFANYLDPEGMLYSHLFRDL